MSNRFYFGDDSTDSPHTLTNYSSDDDANNNDDAGPLPFPKPLSRPSFLTPDFEAHAFLASLSNSNRFQSLEDLATELRELSATINKELVDLVNANYEEFVRLGADLRGGEDKVEEVRVGLLGFEKDIHGLKDRVVDRRKEVEGLVKQKRELRKEIGFGRGLLEIDQRLSLLENRVGLRDRAKSVATIQPEDEQGDNEVNWSEGWDEDSLGDSDEDEDNGDGVPGRVKALVESYLIAKTLVKRYDPGHPFLVTQKDRMQRVQDRVRLEVESVIRGTDVVALKQKLIQLRTQMDD